MTAGWLLGEGSVSPAHGLVGKYTREPPFSPTEHGGDPDHTFPECVL